MAFAPSIPARARVLPIVLALLASTAVAAHAAPGLRFAADYRWFDAGHVGQDLVSADFDGDGIADVALTHPRESSISILMGEAGGGFRPRIGFAAGPDPVDLTALDADGDGRMDLVVSNRTAGTLSILRNLGDGKFAPRRIVAVGGPVGPALGGDLDGDGVVDLVVTLGADRGEVGFLRGRADGSFDAPLTLLRGAGPMCLAVAQDPGHRPRRLVVAAADGKITTLRAVPGGRFRAVDEQPVAGRPAAIVSADVDRDGEPDLVVALETGPPGDPNGPGVVHMLRGTANGRFESADAVPVDFVASAFATADVDRDGWLDLLAADRRGGAVAVFRGDRAGRLLPPVDRVARTGFGNFATGDWNCDGLPDLVALSPRGRGVVLFEGKGDGRFGDPGSLETKFGPAALWLGDVDGDAVSDLVAVDPFAERLAVLKGDGGGGFAPLDQLASYRTEFAPGRVLGARLRPGGPVDLVLTHVTHDGFLSIARNRGDGTFTFADEDTVHTGGLPRALVLGDVDSDGVIDAVVANDGSTSVAVLLGDGAGRFRRDAVINAGTSRPLALALGDLDGDTHLDLVVASDLSHRIAVWKGTGAGTFVPGQEFLAGLRPLSLALADLDGDGHLDLLSGQEDAFPYGGRVVVYLGDGTGGFLPYAPGRTMDVGFEPVDLVVADFDHSPPIDVAVVNAGSSTVSILAGRFHRRYSFAEPLTLGTGAGAEAIVAGDIDRDGRTDVVFAGTFADRVGVLLNRSGDPVPAAPSVALDIAPGTCPSVLPREGMLRVALLSGGAFDLADVLPRTAELEGVPARRDALELADDSGPADTCGEVCGCDGRAPDGVPDARFEFDAAEIVARLGPTRDDEPRRLRFSVRLRGGRLIEVSDCVLLEAPSARTLRAGSGVDPTLGLSGANPLVPGGRIAWDYTVPAGGADVRIGVFTVAGRRVASLVGAYAPEGTYTARWSAHDAAGRPVAPGVYFLRAQVGTTRTAARLIVVP